MIRIGRPPRPPRRWPTALIAEFALIVLTDTVLLVATVLIAFGG